MFFRTYSIAALCLVTACYGQRPERPFGGPPGFRLAAALDVNQDGKISATEIDQAAAALKKLDTDKDGKLSGKEIGWPPDSRSVGGVGRFPNGGQRGGFGGRGGPGGFGGRGGPGGFGGRGGPGGFGGRGRFAGQDRGPARRPDPDTETSLRSSGQQRGDTQQDRRGFFSVRQLKSLDRDQDGRISSDEIPSLMRAPILERLDTDRDGAIDSQELNSLATIESESNR